MTTYTIYTSNWFQHNSEWPDGLEPIENSRRKIGTAQDETRAQEIAAEWNAKHKPGKLKRRARYTDNYKRYKGNSR